VTAAEVREMRLSCRKLYDKVKRKYKDAKQNAKMCTGDVIYYLQSKCLL